MREFEYEVCIEVIKDDIDGYPIFGGSSFQSYTFRCNEFVISDDFITIKHHGKIVIQLSTGFYHIQSVTRLI